jgi:transcriptional regulator with XRE-family HTH domain
MAEIVGVTQTAWGKWELGQRTPDRYKLPKVVALLKISMEYLLGHTLDGVERNLALRIAAAHPELVPPIKAQ